MAAGQVGGKFGAEQLRVAACHDQPSLLPLKAVDPQLPARHVLDFVQQNVPGPVVEIVDGSQYFIEVRVCAKPFIVEVDIARFAEALHQMNREEGLTRPSGPDDDLDQMALLHAGPWEGTLSPHSVPRASARSPASAR